MVEKQTTANTQIRRTKGSLHVQKKNGRKTITLFLIHFYSSQFIMMKHIVTLLILVITYIYYKSKREQRTLPPRAPGYLPIIGHLLQIIKPIPIHQLFFDWSQAVGPIFTCYFGSQRWIVLNSIDIIKDLVVDRGAIYSSRNLPDTLVHDFMQGGRHF